MLARIPQELFFSSAAPATVRRWRRFAQQREWSQSCLEHHRKNRDRVSDKRKDRWGVALIEVLGLEQIQRIYVSNGKAAWAAGNAGGLLSGTLGERTG